MIYPGTADLEGILQDEVTGKYIQKLQTVSEERGKILIMGKIILYSKSRKGTNTW